FFFFFQAEDGIRDRNDWSSAVCSSDLIARRLRRLEWATPPSKSVWMCTGRKRVAHSSRRNLRAICSADAACPHPSHGRSVEFDTIMLQPKSPAEPTLQPLAVGLPHCPCLVYSL